MHHNIEEMQKHEDCEVERDEEVVDKSSVTAAKMANHKTDSLIGWKQWGPRKGKFLFTSEGFLGNINVD